VWWEALGDLRARYGRIVNARPGEVALAPSISVALSTVAESLDYTRRPKVVITSLDSRRSPTSGSRKSRTASSWWSWKARQDQRTGRRDRARR